MLLAGALVNFTDWGMEVEPIDRLGTVVGSFDECGESGYHIRDEDGEMFYGVDAQDVWER